MHKFLVSQVLHTLCKIHIQMKPKYQLVKRKKYDLIAQIPLLKQVISYFSLEFG